MFFNAFQSTDAHVSIRGKVKTATVKPSTALRFLPVKFVATERVFKFPASSDFRVFVNKAGVNQMNLRLVQLTLTNVKKCDRIVRTIQKFSVSTRLDRLFVDLAQQDFPEMVTLAWMLTNVKSTMVAVVFHQLLNALTRE